MNSEWGLPKTSVARRSGVKVKHTNIWWHESCGGGETTLVWNGWAFRGIYFIICEGRCFLWCGVKVELSKPWLTSCTALTSLSLAAAALLVVPVFCYPYFKATFQLTFLSHILKLTLWLIVGGTWKGEKKKRNRKINPRQVGGKYYD